ncbi:MAG: filamentous hemagglutinin N-terminal domain-containing protein, partial [Oscillatoriales cyanobacterium]
TANFLTNPNIQNILGRINGGNPSVINGLIQVTGGNSNLFLMNPSGIIFGQNALLNVPGSFNATAATGIGFGNNQWFSAIGNNNWASLIGNPNSFAFTSPQAGSIVNAGNLTVAPGQSLSLIGGTVVNTGQLTAPSGNITVMAVPGQNLVRIAQTGNLLSLEIQPTASQSSLPNNFAQPVLSLPQLLTGKSQEQATNLTVNANGDVVLAGNVAVPVVPGTAIASGSINVSGNTGGNVSILGDRVGAIAANIDASGINGGGNVLIGGDFQGLGTVPNALRTFVSADSTINVDAISNGNGGRAIVWADETTRFNGNITARGGLLSGNGGFVEVSGKQFLDFRGNVNTLAANGNPGLLLLDPTNITIQNGAGTFTALTQVDQFADPDIGGNTIDAALINSAATNVILQATNDITFNAPVNIATPGVGLTALANNNIDVKANITTKAGNVTLNADADNLNGGSLTIGNVTINTNGGNFTGIGRANVATTPGINVGGKINANGGNIDLNGSAGNTANNTGLEIFTGTLTTTGTGKITLNGTSGSSLNSDGIVLRSSTITSVDGDITFTGIGSGSAKYGIRLVNNDLVESTGTGKVNLTGTGGNGIGSTGGIFIANNGLPVRSKVLSKDGDITLTGTGSGSGDNNTGIAILGLVESTGIGKVTLNGVASDGNGNNNNEGILISFPAQVRSTNTGDITFTGTGKGSGDNNTGILIQGLVESTGTGKVTLNGVGGDGKGNNNQGINIDVPAQVGSTKSGDITFTGTGKGSGKDNIGIAILGLVESKGTGGNVTLTGDRIQLLAPSEVKGAGTIRLQPLTPSLGITVGGTDLDDPNVLQLRNAELARFKGFNEMVIGRADGKGTIAINPAGVTFPYSTTLQSPSGGAIAVNGPITTQDKSISFVGKVSLGNDVTLNTKNLSGGNITFGGTVDGNNKLNITAGTGTVNFNGPVGDTNPLAALGVNPEANITSTGAISIKTTGDIATANITTKNPGGAIALTSNKGNITTSGSVNTSASGGDITLKASKNVNVAQINSGTGNISLIGKEANFGGAANSVQGTGTFSLQPFDASGNIQFINGLANPVDPNTIYVGQQFQDALQDGFKSIAIGRTDGTGTITFDRPHSFQDPVTVKSPGGAIVINQPLTGKDNASIVFDGKTTLNAGVSTIKQDITFQSPVLVQDNASVNTGAGANILFNNTVKGALTGTKDLSLTAGTGNIIFTGAVGDKSAIGNLKVNSQGTILFNETVNAASLTTDTGGTTILNGNVTTTGSQTYQNTVTITKINPTLTAGNGITFKNIVNLSNSGSDFTVDGGTGDVTFSSAVGNLSAIGNLKVNSQGITAFNKTVNAASLITDGGGTTTLNGDVTTTGPQTYGDAVTTAKNLTLSGTGITFNNTVKSNNISDLTVDGTTGDVTFKDAVGDKSAIGNLTTLSKGTTAFNKTVNAASLTAGGGGTTQLKGDVTTTGSQTYTDAVTIANNPILKAGSDVTFNNTVDGSGDLKVNAGSGNITFNGAVGSPKDLGNLTTNSTGTTAFNQTINAASLTTDAGGKTQVKGNVTTTGNQTYGDAVTLNAAVTFTLGNATIAFDSSLSAGSNPLTLKAGEINFAGPVSGTGALTLQPATAGQNIVVGGTDNTTPALDLTPSEIKLIQKGFSSIAIGRSDGTGNITIPSDRTFSDPVTIQTGTGTIALNANITGKDNSSLTLNGKVQLGSDAILSSDTGNVSVAGAIDGSRRLNINATKGNVLLQGDIGKTTPLTGLNVTALNTKLGGNVTTNNGNINIDGAIGLTNDAVLSTAGGNIAFGSAIDSIDAARNLTLDSGSGSITFNGSVGASSKLGNILIKNAGDVTANSTINAAQVTAQNTKTFNLLGDVTAGKVNITSNGDITVKNITTNGGEIFFKSGNVFTAGNLNTSGSTSENINVNITATGDISVKNVTTNGGEIFFKSGNVFTAGNLNTSGSTGGNITVDAKISITAGQINSSGTAGNGGNVLLDPIGDIQVGFINAQGGTNGKGGNVTAVAGNFFRATGSFPTTFSPTGFASISTAGGTDGGNISIAHTGGDGGGVIQPFVVGNATINGTAAAITTGPSSITSQSFPRTASGVPSIVFPTDDGIDPTPTPTPIPTPNPTPTPIATPTPNPTPTPVVVQTPSPTPTPIAIQTPSPTPTPIAIQTPSPTPT